jgi:predicted ATP-dependent endonuclease of OLD family
MKLKRIKIEKFRGIRLSEINVGNELAIVGQNSAGKSSILRALNAFFNFDSEQKSFTTGRHSFQNTSTSVIEVEFSDVPIACTLPRTNANSTNIIFRLRYKKSPIWQVYSSGTWQALQADWCDELRKFIKYVYVPLRRDHEVSGWGDNGLLKSVVDAWMLSHTSKRDTISPQVSRLASFIQNGALKGLTKHLDKVTPINGNFAFNLEFGALPDYRLLINELVLKISEGDIIVDIEDCGSGTQSLSAFALYSYLAELEGNTYILGIEEPEQNLHPQAQRELLKSLKSLPMQVLFTTHSTVIVDELDHDEVVLCRRIKSSTRDIEINTTQLDSGFWRRNNLDKNKYYQFYKRRNSEFFFSNFVILTESPIDSEIVKKLILDAKLDPIEYGVSVLSLDGVDSLPYAFHLLRELSFSFATIVDKDYFLPYLNDELANSRSTNGFPRYKREYQAGTIIDKLLPDLQDRNQLLNLFHSNHSKAMTILEKFNVYCFKWSLEIDLVNSGPAKQLLYRKLGIPSNQQSSKTLLENYHKALKRLEHLMPTVSSLKPTNLPNSYSRIRKSLPLKIRANK